MRAANGRSATVCLSVVIDTSFNSPLHTFSVRLDQPSAAFLLFSAFVSFTFPTPFCFFRVASFPSSFLSSISIFFPFWLASSDLALLFLTSIFYQSYQSTSYHDQYWARDAVSHSRSYLHASPIYVISVHLSPATLYRAQNLLPELPLRLTFTSISFSISSSTISLLRQLGLFMPTTREHTCSFVQIRARTTS